jgi:Catalytic LigB subunit of aromatic ring-opening dioxygenase
MPAVSIFNGDEILAHERPITPQTSGWAGAVMKGYVTDTVDKFPGHPDFAFELIKGLIDNDVDIGAASKVEDPHKAGFGHAHGFVIERLFGGRLIPVVPVLLNTYYRPNAPTARRCHDICTRLARLIGSSPRGLRVVVAAGGGLSHFVVDEKLDRKVLKAIKEGSAAAQTGAAELVEDHRSKRAPTRNA